MCGISNFRCIWYFERSAFTASLVLKMSWRRACAGQDTRSIFVLLTPKRLVASTGCLYLSSQSVTKLGELYSFSFELLLQSFVHRSLCMRELEKFTVFIPGFSECVPYIERELYVCNFNSHFLSFRLYIYPFTILSTLFLKMRASGILKKSLNDGIS